MNGRDPFDANAAHPWRPYPANDVGSALPPSSFGGGYSVGTPSQPGPMPPAPAGYPDVPQTQFDPAIKRAVLVVGAVIAAFFVMSRPGPLPPPPIPRNY